MQTLLPKKERGEYDASEEGKKKDKDEDEEGKKKAKDVAEQVVFWGLILMKFKISSDSIIQHWSIRKFVNEIVYQ